MQKEWHTATKPLTFYFPVLWIRKSYRSRFVSNIWIRIWVRIQIHNEPMRIHNTDLYKLLSLKGRIRPKRLFRMRSRIRPGQEVPDPHHSHKGLQHFVMNQSNFCGVVPNLCEIFIPFC
jgi:hypothetical protein